MYKTDVNKGSVTTTATFQKKGFSFREILKRKTELLTNEKLVFINRQDVQH